MTNCPPKLRGDLSKWLCEINTGVYVGNVSSRVRDALWERVCQNLKNGQATLVFTTAGEQRMDFRTHNTAWETVDFDGIKLMRRPLPQAEQNQIDLKPGFSKAAQQQMARKAGRTKPSTGNYTVIDLETTGLKAGVRFHHRIWSAAGPGRCTGGGADHAGLRGRKRSGRDHSPDRTQRCGIAAGNRTTGSAE